MRKLWSEEKTSHSGEFVSFKDARAFPKPVQRGNLPIIFGGESAPALRRVAEYGTGWFGFNLNPADAAAKVAKLHALMRERGRATSEVELIVSPYLKGVAPADLRGYREIGISEIVMLLNIPEDESKLPAQLEQMAREWVEPAAKLG
jgi:alkanesulfonate monooxygenase SsuD/methylene tetrahydromethanopterin reductase-like flavin-dependent oxidoreductase (luciferase family)